MVIYTLTAVSYVAVLPLDYDWGNSGQIAADWASAVLGPTWQWTIPVCVVASCWGSLNGTVFTAGRVVYSAAREGHFPAIISFVNHRLITPFPAILFNFFITEIFLLIAQLTYDPTGYYGSPIEVLLDMYMVVALLAYGSACLSLVVLRWTRPEVDRPFKIWLPVPIIMVVFFWGSLALPFTGDLSMTYPGKMFLDNLYYLAPGLLGYGLNWWRRKHLAPTHSINLGINRAVTSVSVALQILMQVVPEKED